MIGQKRFFEREPLDKPQFDVQCSRVLDSESVFPIRVGLCPQGRNLTSQRGYLCLVRCGRLACNRHALDDLGEAQALAVNDC